MEGQQHPGTKVLTWLREYMEAMLAVFGVDQLAGLEQVRLTAVAGWSENGVGYLPVSRGVETLSSAPPYLRTPLTCTSPPSQRLS